MKRASETAIPSTQPPTASVASGTEYELFGALLIVWVMKGTLLSLSGPEQLYDFQRFLAAKNPRALIDVA